MSVYSVNWQLTILFCNIFFIFLFTDLLIQSTKYYQIRNLRVQIGGNRYFSCPISKIVILAAIFVFFFENAVIHIFQSFQPISLILNSKQRKEFIFNVLKFEENRSKILRPWECRNRKQLKWPPWRHQIWIFKIGEKRTSLIYCRWFVESFIKIDPLVWAVEMTQIDTHPHRQTDRHPGVHCNIFWLNIKKGVVMHIPIGHKLCGINRRVWILQAVSILERGYKRASIHEV